MLTKYRPIQNTRKLIWSTTIALVAILVTISIASATLYTIDTNNNSSSDWSSVPLFQTDSSGDLNVSCTGGTGRDDIIETYVASGPPGGSPTHIYFRVVTAAPNAISDQLHQVGVIMDCATAGEDDLDVNVIYRGYPDQVILADNHKPNPDQVASYAAPGPEGERPADALNSVEWSGSFADMAAFSPPLNCTVTSVAQIKFRSYKVLFPSGLFDCLYDETSFKGFNIPTAVQINSLSASSNSEKNRVILSVTAFAAAVLIGCAGFVITHKKKT